MGQDLFTRRSRRSQGRTTSVPPFDYQAVALPAPESPWSQNEGRSQRCSLGVQEAGPDTSREQVQVDTSGGPGNTGACPVPP